MKFFYICALLLLLTTAKACGETNEHDEILQGQECDLEDCPTCEPGTDCVANVAGQSQGRCRSIEVERRFMQEECAPNSVEDHDDIEEGCDCNVCMHPEGLCYDGENGLVCGDGERRRLDGPLAVGEECTVATMGDCESVCGVVDECDGKECFNVVEEGQTGECMDPEDESVTECGCRRRKL